MELNITLYFHADTQSLCVVLLKNVIIIVHVVLLKNGNVIGLITLSGCGFAL